jgi:hypothetical protein
LGDEKLMLSSTLRRAFSTDSMLMSEATDLVGEESHAADERFVDVFFDARVGEEEEEERWGLETTGMLGMLLLLLVRLL